MNKSAEDVVGNWSEDAERIRAALPRHILFLCLQNSARSQMAEAITRALAAPGVKVSSAGARRSSVHPLAIQVLAELGIDISRNLARNVTDIPVDDVDVAITLCADHVDAALPANTLRVDWPLPDPTVAEGSEADRIEAFRSVRDELIRRLAVVFAGARPLSTT
jgi:arsenate reductase